MKPYQNLVQEQKNVKRVVTSHYFCFVFNLDYVGSPIRRSIASVANFNEPKKTENRRRSTIASIVQPSTFDYDICPKTAARELQTAGNFQKVSRFQLCKNFGDVFHLCI